MVIAIIVSALWVALFVPMMLIPFLPQVDTPYAPAPRELVPRVAGPPPTVQHQQAA